MKINYIAEVGSNHNKSIKRCYKIIDKAKDLGFHTIKFQLFRINKLFSKDAKKVYKTVLNKKKRELPLSFIPKISKYCKTKKIKFSCTPFDLESAIFLEKYVDFYKIASYELNWEELLLFCAKTKKPIIISTGMATYLEVKKAFDKIKSYNKKISLLHCVSAYPAKVESCNLESIRFLKNKFNCPVGWSDHTVNPLIIYKAISKYKAQIVELHFDIDGQGWEQKEGNQHCWTPKDIEKLFRFINSEKKIEGKYFKKYSTEEIAERKFRADPLDGLRPLKKFRKYL
tara:strand:+ start:92 stop:946 length:855 start_codon:yes stop_codon:yes gene_type:complete